MLGRHGGMGVQACLASGAGGFCCRCCIGALGTVTRRRGAAGVMWCRQRQGRGMGVVYLVIRMLSGL